MEILRTERLLLRRLRPEDLDRLAALYADPEMRGVGRGSVVPGFGSDRLRGWAIARRRQP